MLHSNPRIYAGMKRNLNHKESCHPPNNHSGFTQALTMNELKAALGKLKPHKAPGSNQITNEMIINIGRNGMAVLLRLINITWKTGQLPKDWKTAVLIPLLKKNTPKSAPSSYRPISLTSSIGTLVDRMINERLNWWLEHNNIITPCQAGIRSNYTTEDQLIRLTQKIQNGFQMNKDTIAVFVDLEKAYDKVWRQGLFIKTRDAGINSNMYRWINNFITDRTIATLIEGVTSTKECLKEGIPQGSSLSCTLFTMYINGIVKYLPDPHTALYADDIVLCSTSANMYSAQANVNVLQPVEAKA